MDRLKVTVLQSSLVPDYNRDGMIDDADKGKVSSKEPWRFWVNDDNDNGAFANGITTKASNDLPGTYGDLDDQPVPGSVIIDPSGTNVAIEHVIGNIRDYVDFFPIHVDIGGLMGTLPLVRANSQIKGGISSKNEGTLRQRPLSIREVSLVI